LRSPHRHRRFEQPETDVGGPIRPPQLARNEHLKKLEEHFGAFARDPADFPADVTCVFLCFANRSGSNYLAELLASGGAYNRGAEILNHAAVLEISKRRKHERFQDFFADLARRQHKSGRFFVKAALQHLDILTRAGVLDQIADRSQFVMIERNDVLAQAISFALAFGTRAFSSEAEASARPQDVT
jgi:LPS sulfotransferase NodH